MGVSFSSFPRARRDGLGTCRACAATSLPRGGCRGFIGPFPLPLWMRYSVVWGLQDYDGKARRGPARALGVGRLGSGGSGARRRPLATGSTQERRAVAVSHGVSSTTGEVSSSSRCSSPSWTVTKICSPVPAPAGQGVAVDREPGGDDPVALDRLGAEGTGAGVGQRAVEREALGCPRPARTIARHWSVRPARRSGRR